MTIARIVVAWGLMTSSPVDRVVFNKLMKGKSKINRFGEQYYPAGGLKRQIFRRFADRGRGVGVTEALDPFLVMEGGMGGAAVCPLVEHDQVVAHDFGGEFLISFFIFPAAGP